LATYSPDKIRQAGRQAYQKFLSGQNRQTVLADLQRKFGTEGIFAFGQAEYYSRRRPGGEYGQKTQKTTG
jgi:hypothetical protein